MSLTLQEARTRSALIHDVDSVVHVDITPTDRYVIDTTITFSSTDVGATSFLELIAAEDVSIATSAGIDATYDGARIALTNLQLSNTITIRATMPYVTDGDGMTATVDPADGERYVSAYTAMDIAQKVIPCFDQPDIKTSFTLSVTAPPTWTVLANGLFDRRDGDTWYFHTTPRFSTYIFFFCGGPFVSMTWDEPYVLADGGTLPFGWHARASQRLALERDFEAMKSVTSRAFQHYTSVFDEPYPFADYQQVFTPGLNWGAMEFPGCVAFRDEYLTPAPPTALQSQGLTSVIAHEMAHMWFGDLVTMQWWEDSWLNESFADYMGYEIGSVASGALLWTGAALGRKPTAYRADARRSTHRIAEDPENLPDVDTAFANFDMITYAKGNAVLRQLVTWLGEEDFLRGVNKHLSAHPFGTATLADFLDALDSSTDRDVRAWAELWLRTTGFDIISVARSGDDGADVPMLSRTGSRPHRFLVTGFDTTGTAVVERLVDLADEPVSLPEFTGLAIVPNSSDQTYARLHFDDASRTVLDATLTSIASPLTRALLWSTAIAEVEDGRRSVNSLMQLASTQLVRETDATVAEGALGAVMRVVGSHSVPEEIDAHLETMATVADALLTSASAPHEEAELSPLASAALRVLARTSSDVADLQARLADLNDQAVRWIIVTRLAELGVTDLIDAEAQRDRTTAGSYAALGARAAIATRAAKEAAWAQLVSGELSNREFTATASGFWGLQQSELVDEWIRRAPAEFAELARKSGQGMGQIISQGLPVMPMLDGGAAFAVALRAALARDLPVVAARGFNDRLDDVEMMRATRR